MTIFLLCLLFIACMAVSWRPALVQPATVGRTPTESTEGAAPRDKGLRMGQTLDARTNVDVGGGAGSCAAHRRQL